MTNTVHHQQSRASMNLNATDNGQGGGAPNEASAALAEAIDDFLGDLEKKFKGISQEILTKLDDMAERCDRLEQEMLVRETNSDTLGGAKAGPGSAAGSG